MKRFICFVLVVASVCLLISTAFADNLVYNQTCPQCNRGIIRVRCYGGPDVNIKIHTHSWTDPNGYLRVCNITDHYFYTQYYCSSCSATEIHGTHLHHSEHSLCGANSYCPF